MSDRPPQVEIAPGVLLWPGYFTGAEQRELVGEVLRLAEDAPFYRPRMPRSGRPFSVEETNFGTLGWISDDSGYRYDALHPQTGRCWPAVPGILAALWRRLTGCAVLAECCLVNLYRSGARMGLHQDRDEAAFDVPVVSVSLGDSALFRIGGTTRKSPTKSLTLASGDVLMFGGAARLAFHGVDRIAADSSSLVPGGGRLNLTLRRVAEVPK